MNMGQVFINHSNQMAPSYSYVVFIFMLLQFLKCHAKVSAIIVFGDSTVDSGNNDFIPTPLRSNFNPYGRDFAGGKPTGRFCNGRLPPDFFSEAFGLKPSIPAYLDPSYTIQDFATGVCFASAGTGYDDETSKVLNVMPLRKELEYFEEYQSGLRSYLGNEKANEVVREALFIISIGTNDFLENYYLLPRRSSQFSVEDYQKYLVGISRNFIMQIYELGARKISLTGLPPMGCVPLERTTNIGNCIDEYNKVAIDFNHKLQEMVENLNQELSGIQLVNSNVYNFLYDIIINPHSYGFENSAKACCGSGRFELGYLCDEHNPLTCSDASKYVFWDSFHPTEKTNSILSEYIMKQYLARFK